QAELGNFAAANTSLNAVRNRAGLANANITEIENFRNEILDQRRKEFVAEGQRWFDLVRMNKLNEKVHAAKDKEYTAAIPTLNENYNVFPIPQKERDVNPNLVQNAGF